MRAIIPFLLLTVLLSLCITVGFSQNQVVKQLQNEALQHMDASRFKKAFETYEKLLAIDPENSQYNFEMGVCIYKGAFDKAKSLPYFQKAYDNNTGNTSPELFYYLGKAYHYTGNFLFAQAAYNTARAYLANSKAGKELERELDLLVEQAEQGKNKEKEMSGVILAETNVPDEYKFYLNGNRYIKIQNLGPTINSEFSEYGPLFLNQDQNLIFTSRKEGTTGGEMYFDDQYYEDIYLATFKGKNLIDVVNINNTDFFNNALKNTAKHDATVAVNQEETEIFLYYNNQVMELIKGSDGKWLSPKSLSANMAALGNQVTSAVTSANGQMLLLTGTGNDSYGGRDIYYAEKNAEGKWGSLKNFGEPVNTDFDESSPYMPNDTTLYFSSKGHSSIGGYDIFVSHFRNGSWTEPEDLNSPINTPFDEINYRISKNRTFAYYASDRSEGYGNFDIYKITKGFDLEVDPEIAAKFGIFAEVDSNQNIALNENFNFYEEESNGLYPETSLEQLKSDAALKEKLANQKAGEKLTSANQNEINQLKQDKTITVEKTSDGTLSVTEKFEGNAILPSDIKKEALENLKKFNVPNEFNYSDPNASLFIFEQVAHFGYNSVLLTDYSKKFVDVVIQFINDNPNRNFTIKLYGHTDSKGSPESNMKVAQNRIESIKAYLTQQGIKANIETKAFGESRPRMRSETPENAIFNRRVQIRVYINK